MCLMLCLARSPWSSQSLGIPTAGICCISTGEATSAPNRFANISVPAVAARCSIGRWPNTTCGNARWWWRHWHMQMSSRRSTISSMPMVPGGGARCSMRDAGPMTFWRSGLRRHVLTTSSPLMRAPSWRRAWRRTQGRLGDCRNAQTYGQTARYPDDRNGFGPRHRRAWLGCSEHGTPDRARKRRRDS